MGAKKTEYVIKANHKSCQKIIIDFTRSISTLMGICIVLFNIEEILKAVPFCQQKKIQSKLTLNIIEKNINSTSTGILLYTNLP